MALAFFGGLQNFQLRLRQVAANGLFDQLAQSLGRDGVKLAGEVMRPILVCLYLALRLARRQPPLPYLGLGDGGIVKLNDDAFLLCEALQFLLQRGRRIAAGAIEVAQVVDMEITLIVAALLDGLETNVSEEKPRATMSGTSYISVIG